jgi:putative membrane protein
MKDAVKGVVKEIEQQTSAEIVVAVRPESGYYRAADLYAGGVLAFAALCVFLYHPHPFDFTFLPFELLIAFGVGMLLSMGIPPLRRLLSTRRVRTENVETAGRAAFVEHNVHMTSARTGVLVYVSWFERRVIVLADVGVPLDEIGDRWTALAVRLHQAVLKGNPETFLSSLRYFGAVLAEVLPRAPEDENELPDEVQEEAS